MRTDDVLDQIDLALHDNTVSGDAMRSRPVPERPGRSILVKRLVERHGLEAEQARRAVVAVELGRDDEHVALVQAEARAAMNETMQAFRAALRPMAEAANTAAKQIAEALKALRTATASPPAPGRRTDRPAWQSPYGPARRR